MIQEYFINGKSIKEISELIGVNQNKIRKQLNSLGFYSYLDNPIKAILLKEIALEYIKDNSKSISELCKLHNLNKNSLSNEIKRQGGIIVNKQNITKFDDTVFDNIDSEEKAYWLGFIFADGTISSHIPGKKPRYQFELSLALKDKGHLEKFGRFMKYNNVKCDSYRCRWIINSKHLWETLNNIGCVPNKSKILQFPQKLIDSNFTSSFVRGYMDGDGCIGIYRNRLYCQCIGTKQFLNQIKESFSIDVNLGHDLRWSDEVFSFQLGGDKCYYFLYKLYNNATIYLDRKYNKYLEICRLWEESHKLLSDNIGESCDANTEITSEITKGLEVS